MKTLYYLAITIFCSIVLTGTMMANNLSETNSDFLQPVTEVSCSTPFTPTLVQESDSQFLVSWTHGFTETDSTLVTVTLTSCSGITTVITETIDYDAPMFMDFVIDPGLAYANITVVINFICPNGCISDDSPPAVFEFNDCVPCFTFDPETEISFSCSREGLLCVVLNEQNLADENDSIYGVCDIGGNGTSGACYDLSNLPEGAESLQVTLCEYRTGFCDTKACCVVLDVPIPPCAACPTLPFELNWCCNIDPGQPACLCATDEDGVTHNINNLPGGYWISDMNIPGICVYYWELPPVFTPVTIEISDNLNVCHYTLEMPGPNCWGIIGDGGNFNDQNNDGDNTLTLYPNPVIDVLFVENKYLETIEYEIVDMQGRVLRKGMMNNENLELQIQDFDPGVYYLNYKTKNQEVKNSKFVKI